MPRREHIGHSEIRKCLICKKEFKAWTYRIKKGCGIVCSRKCNGIYKKRLWQDKTKHPRWCSFKVKCKQCSKEFLTRQYIIDKGQGKFCSRKCFEVSHRKQKTLIKCPTCGKERWRLPCELERGKLFCSRKCSGLYNIKKMPLKDTMIEVKLEQWLKDNKINYIKQHRIKNISVVDFFIPPNTCLFADGDYWHSPKLNKGKDVRQNIELKASGYDVIRIWEKDINAGIRPIRLLEKKNAEV